MELLDILKITWEVMEINKQTGNLTPRQKNYPEGLATKHTDQKIKSDNADVFDANSNMPDYFKSAKTKQQAKEQARCQQKRYAMHSMMYFEELGDLKVCLGDG